MDSAGPSLTQAIRSIFIADDDSDDMEFFKEAMNTINASIHIEYMQNGVALTHMLSSYLPDLLFLDLDMPAKNGLQCLKEIRSNPVTSSLPVIVFSSTNRPANIDTAYDMGAHLFFIKPSNYNEWVRSIDAILKLNWSQPERVKERFCIDGECHAFR